MILIWKFLNSLSLLPITGLALPNSASIATRTTNATATVTFPNIFCEKNTQKSIFIISHSLVKIMHKTIVKDESISTDPKKKNG